jgi:hypothetical protein
VSRKRKVGILPRPAWLLPLEDPFQRMRDRLGSSKDAKNELEALLRDPDTRSANSYVDASGKETLSLLNAEFWRDTARLEVDTDADGVDHIRVDYPRYVHLSDGPAEFFVRADDVERWERPYSMTAPPRPPASHAPDQQQSRPTEAPPSTAAAPAVSVTQDVSREAQGVVPSNTGADEVTTVRNKRRSIKESRVIEVLHELDRVSRVPDDLEHQPAQVQKIVKPHYRDVSRRVCGRAYKIFLNERSANKSRQT